jgi:hypothetical protein
MRGKGEIIMPYIYQERREEIDQIVDYMEDWHVESNGDLNYLLFAYCKRTVEPGYVNYRNYCAELRACATEIERRLLAPYEDLKIEENGDII